MSRRTTLQETQKNLRRGEIGVMITAIAALLMVAGSLIGLSSNFNNSQNTKSLAACTFNPRAFIKININGQSVPLTTSIDAKLFDNGVWQTKNDRSATSFLNVDGSTGLVASNPSVDLAYCCGDAGFNNEVGWKNNRSYKVGSDKASVRLYIKDARYEVTQKCPYDPSNPENPKCYDIASGDDALDTIDNLPVDCLKYDYGWIVKCEGLGCPRSTGQLSPTPIIQQGRSWSCKVHFIIDNSSSVEKFKDITKAKVEDVIKKYKTIPGHQNDTIKVNYQFFNKDVNLASQYVDPSIFAFPDPFPQENWTNIDAAVREAVETSTPNNKVVNILLSDGKPTVLNVDVDGNKEQCSASYDTKLIDGCRICLRSAGAQSCPYPYQTNIDSCPERVKQACLALDYTQKYITDLTSKQWVDYSVAIGNTPDTDVLNKIAKNGVINEDDLPNQLARLFERECGIPAPSPGRERGRDISPTLAVNIDNNKADLNKDKTISALDIAVCLNQKTSDCDFNNDGLINAIDRSVHINLLGLKL